MFLRTWHDASLGHVDQQGEPLAVKGVVEVPVVVVPVPVEHLGGVAGGPGLKIARGNILHVFKRRGMANCLMKMLMLENCRAVRTNLSGSGQSSQNIKISLTRLI